MIEQTPCVLPSRRKKISKAEKVLERAQAMQKSREVTMANEALVAAKEVEDRIKGQVADDVAAAKEVVRVAVEEAGAIMRKGEAIAGHIMSTTMQTGNATARIEELLKKHGAEPAEELIKMATETLADGTFMLSTDQRITVWSKLLEYRHPKLRAQEVKSVVDHSVTVVVRKFENNDVLRKAGIVDIAAKKSAIQEDGKNA